MLSSDRILTTHVGSLPRPQALLELITAKEQGLPVDAAAFEARSAAAVAEVVQQQVASGIDIVSDGEMSKSSYTFYVRHRVTGIGMNKEAAEKGRDIMIGRDQIEHPDFAARNANFRGRRFPGLHRPGELCRPRPARARSGASGRRGEDGEADRGVHDRALARHPHALRHRYLLPQRGRLCRSARGGHEDGIRGDRARGVHSADRLSRSRLGAQQPVPRQDRCGIPAHRPAQCRGAQPCDRLDPARRDATPHLLGQLRGSRTPTTFPWQK